MKTFVFFFFALFVTLSISAQSYYNYVARINNSSGEEIIHPEMDQYAIATSNDEVAVIINVYEPASDVYHMKILALDNSGNENWEVKIPDFIGKQIIETDDGNYLIIGFSEDNDDLYLQIMKISRTSGIQMARWQFNNASQYVTNVDDPALIIRTNEAAEHYIAIIEISQYFGEILVFKIDDIGLIDWINIYEVPNKSAYYHMASVTNRLVRNGFLVGFRGIQSMFYAIDYQGNPVKAFCISGVNYNHNLVLNRAVGEEITDSYIAALNIEATDDLYILKFDESNLYSIIKLSSSDYNKIQPTSIFYSQESSSIDMSISSSYNSTSYKFTGFISLDFNSGAELSYKRYIAKDPTEWINVSSMINYGTGSYYLKGLTEFSSSDTEKDLQVLSVDGTGNVECSYDLDFDEHMISGEFIIYDVDKLAFEEYPTSVDFMGVSTEQITMLDACEPFSPRKGMPDNIEPIDDATDLMIYPNPANDYLNIVNDNDILKVELYSLTGKLLYSEEINDNFSRLNTTGLEKGLYLITIVTVEETITRSITVN